MNEKAKCELFFYRNVRPVVVRDMNRLAEIILGAHRMKKQPEYLFFSGPGFSIGFDFSCISFSGKKRELFIAKKERWEKAKK